ncbi:MAG: DMT family transporter [Pseudanabaenales cyanobacterium]|nr:DMT family transporter [Pseudanabaenales cyanobacterium]
MFGIPQQTVIVATLWMTGTLISFMALAIGGRELSAHLGTIQILFFRSLVGLCAINALLIKRDRRLVLTQNFGLHLVRNLAHFGGQFGWFYGLAYISLAEVFAIEFTLPIWTAILARVLLKEPLTKPRLMAIGFGIAGMLIILRPGLGVIDPAAWAVLAGAVCYALSHTLTRKLALRDSPLTILFYMTVIQLPLGLLPSLSHWTIPSYTLLPWLAIVGLAALSAHYCMAKALALVDATVVVPMDFLRLPLIALVGFMFYGEPLDQFVLTGATLMLIGNVINIRAEQHRKSAPAIQNPVGETKTAPQYSFDSESTADSS